MKILNNTVANATVAQICEFPENLIISGNVYTKNPLSPLSMKFALIEDPNSSILFNETHDITAMDNVRYRDHKHTYVADEYEDGVVWIFYDRNNIFKATPNEFGYEVKKPTIRNNGGEAPVEVLASNPSEFYKYAFQDKEYIYYWMHTSTDKTNWFLRMDKRTLEITDYFTATTGAGLGYVEPLGYYYDSLSDTYYHYYLYYNHESTSTHYWYIYSFNMTTKTKTSVASNRMNYNNTKLYNKIIPAFIKNNDTNGLILTGLNAGGASYDFYYVVYKYKITNAATMSLTTIYKTNGNYDSPLNHTTGNLKFYLFHPQPNIVCEYVKNKAFNIRKFSADIDFKNAVATTISSYTTTQYSNISAVHSSINSCGSIANDKILFLVNSTKISIWQWNEATLLYELTNEIEDNIEKVGVDFNENIWVRNANGEVYTVPVNYTDYEITISTEETNFDYIGKEIASSFKIKALNRNDIHVSCRVKLKITGAAIFAQNQSKELELELPGQELEIPIIIYDTGIIHISAIS